MCSFGGRKDYLRSKHSGFTLVELLVVIAIIGILSSVLIANFIGVRQRARDGQRKSDLNEIASALESYRADADNYPTLSGSFTLAPCNQPFTNSDNSISYLQKTPCDPLHSSQTFNNGNYVYQSSTGSDYALMACLENSSDKSGVSASQLPSGVPNPSSCSSGTFYEIIDGNTVSSSTGGSSSTSMPTPQPPTNTPPPTFTLTPSPTPSPSPTPTPIPPLAFDAKSSATAPSGSTSLSWSHITTSHPNTILIVPVTTNYPISVGSVTYNGIALTKLVSYNFGYSGDDFWYLENPPSGTHTITVNISGGNSVITAGGLTYYNVDLTNPFGTPVVNNGVSTFSTPTFSVTVPSTSNQLVIDSAAFNDNNDPVVAGSGQTTLWNIKTNNFNGVSSQPGGGNTIMSWTLQNKFSHHWIDVGVPLNP